MTVLGDTAVEPNETFQVVLSAPSGLTIADGTGQVTIANDDTTPPPPPPLVPSVSIGDRSVTEGASGTTTAALTLTLSGPTTVSTTVAWSTANGSATAGSDYTAASGTVTFAAGTTSAQITVTVLGDTAVEPNETFQVVLSAPSGLTIADGTGQVTIANDDTAPPPPPPPPPPGAPTLELVDGGLGYYGQFANPFSTAGSYFPVGGWLRPAHDPEHFGDYANFGMNVFVGVENPELANEAMIRANGMKSIVQDDERLRFNDLGSETAGWLLFDEVDMVQGPGLGYSTLESILAGLPRDGRLRYNNYGKGVLEWESDADAARFINGRNGPNSFQQLVSTDYYWFTDPNARDNPRYGFGSSYGDDVRKVRRLDALDGVRQPVWHFVELGWPWTEGASQGGRRILPAEIRSAVWHSIIAGARGIIYFDHNFGPAVPGSTILEEGYEDNRVAATEVNAQIRSLAPVLNAPFVTSGHSASDSMAGTVRYMVKWQGGKFWLFAGADRGGGTRPSRSRASATRPRPWRARTGPLPVSNGSFTDQFADKNAIHIYRIDGGSSCGLS